MINDFERIPVTVIEIDQDKCALTFSEGACPATGEPCFNTRGSCKALNAYTLGEPLTLRFSMLDRAEGFNEYVIPNVNSVRTDPTRINIGGRRGNTKPLGVRAQATITFVDHPHSDQLVDPYLSQRNYDPFERSTFWAKWLARNPYYANRPLRIKEGFAGQTLAEMQTRHYIIDKIEGPNSNGSVTIRAQDILRLADNDKAKAPALSSGVLLTDIDGESLEPFVVTRGTATEYTQYNTNAVRIGDEVIRFNAITPLGNGDLEFSGITRGSDGSEPQSHDAEDSVQACLQYINVKPWGLIRDLLVDFGNVPSDYINYSEWQIEGEQWLASYPLSRLLTEPVGITTLLGELCEQCLCYVWWDERAQKVRFKVIAPALDGVPLLSEQGNLIADSTTIKVEPDQRASEVWVNFLPRDATEVGEERKHYRRTRVRVDPNATSEFEYGERRVYEVFSAWLVNDTQTTLLAFRLLSTYRDPPKYLSFELDVKDRDIAPSESFDILYRGFVDVNGEPQRVRYDVISSHESPPGQRVKIEAVQSLYGVNERYGRIAPNDVPSYSIASGEDKERYIFIAANNGLMPNGDPGYQII